MIVDTTDLRRWSDAVADWYESGMTTTTMEVAAKLAPLAIAAADELDRLRTALAAVPHSTFCAYMTALYGEPCSCPKSLNTDPAEVSVGGSIFLVRDLPDVLARHMRSLDDAQQREKQHWLEHHEATTT